MGYAGSHPLQVLITWWVSWLHHCKLFQSPCLQDRCWWTHPCCKHLSGISRSLSSPWESRSCGIFWPPPGTKELRYEFTFFSLKLFSSPGHSLVKLSFQLGHLGSLLKFPEAVPEGCSCLAPSGVFLTQELFCSQAEAEPVAPSAVQSWHTSLQAGRTKPHFRGHICTPVVIPSRLFQDSNLVLFYAIPLFPTVSFTVLEQSSLQKWADTTSAITCSLDLHLPPSCELRSSL